MQRNALFAFGLYRVTRELRLPAPRLWLAAGLFALLSAVLIVTQMTFGIAGPFVVVGAYIVLLLLAWRIASLVQANRTVSEAPVSWSAEDGARKPE